MFRRFWSTIAAVLLFAASINAFAEDKVIRIGATSGPQAQVLEVAKRVLERQSGVVLRLYVVQRLVQYLGLLFPQVQDHTRI
ncbi:hypothetical protein QN379_00505 [Glaciimonas sp. Gout2]|uniref:hypothetical protein n=1 Tax=unclassified Glaciimonas TaxID=2644401 RepID=UPI002AB55391|nr:MULTISPECIES: hypothetical protein [unclassified Glaciimonas]MDY7546847.1 hypothetical protein [Glaciimonas sp. CA11.2]MEB0012315.1 hypothetical protein [Glaciimonas sp. Cout2]MEB0080498.1 hypothetical protein [Glaciimonas sp. Gout2]